MSLSRGSSISYRAPTALGDSPPFTAPRAPSTAPTSISNSSSHVHRELEEMKEKHATETAALLGALSDSQRTTRVLRDENNQLRERLEGVEAMSERLAEMERENELLRRLVGDLRSEVREAKTARILGSVGVGVVPRAKGSSSPLRYASSPIAADVEEEVAQQPSPVRRPQVLIPSPLERRHSSSSSVFIGPPSNMSMIMGSDDGLNHLNSDDSYSPSSPTVAIPLARHKEDISVSPTATNFSEGETSPKSLLLRPEDELHLGDLESLDLGLSDVEELR